MALEFGTSPERGTISLTRYGDFVSEIINEDGDWPAGARWEFRFLPAGPGDWIVWQATITGDTALWNVDKVAVAAVLDAKPDVYRLFYIESAFDLEYSKGNVREVS